MDGNARELLTAIEQRQQEISEIQHRLAREAVVLREAATRLRIGEPAGVVSARFAQAGIVLWLRELVTR